MMINYCRNEYLFNMEKSQWNQNEIHYITTNDKTIRAKMLLSLINELTQGQIMVWKSKNNKISPYTKNFMED